MTVRILGKGKNVARLRRHARLRKHVIGTAERPRLVVTRTNRNVIAQIVDDSKGVTLVSESTLTASFSDFQGDQGRSSQEGWRAGAKKAQDAGISAVVFDRGGNKYHGRVAAVAEGAREGGLAL
jgi:large subunit ribosomal protein L18